MIHHVPPSDLSEHSRLIGPARSLLRRLLDRTVVPGIVVEEEGPLERTHHGVAPAGHAPTIVIHDPRAWTATARSGSAGLGEAYFRGWWSTDDLVGVLRVLVRSSEPLDDLRSSVAALTSSVTEPIRRLRRSNPARDRADISAHYDLSNDFFALLLDSSLTYSSAIFSSSEATLEQAQHDKYESWCDLLDLSPETHLVEIGSGWGGMALHAAGQRNCRITTTTVSSAQYDVAGKRIAEAGLEDRIDLLELDYRDLDGRYDRLVSIEMIEAVDWREYPEFFACCERLLTPDGLGGIQAIVIADQRYERAKNTTDFIKRWIFPGGGLPSITALTGAMTAATKLRAVELRDLGPHYAETLARWRLNLATNADAIADLGLDETFLRLFDFYLAYCEAAFRERHVSVVQLVFAGPEWRGEL
ncbi:MAG: class I SAM-dependent methyltransferase [Acidimicrobiales bacterium]|nr:class I SAM-dependent methyltransferase [Acidimicrobiales bacterium]